MASRSTAKACAFLAALAFGLGCGRSGTSSEARPPAEGEAVPRALNVTASPDKIKVTEATTVTIEIRHDKAERYELPRDLSLGPAVDLLSVKADREEDGDEAITRITLRGSVFQLDEVTLADIVLRVTGPSGEKRLTVPGPTLHVSSTLEPDAQLEDVEPPIEVLVARYTLLWALLAALLAGLAAFLIARRLKGRVRPVKPKPVEPKVPAEVRALRALEALQKEDLPAQGRGREFHFRLSEILRGYLGERFGLGALDMTSDELLLALTRVETPGLDLAALERHCRAGDLVKYAKADAPPVPCKAALEEVRGLVQQTTAAASAPQRVAAP